MSWSAAVVEEDINAAALTGAVAHRGAGAVTTFAGVVRDHDHGATVTGIEYVGHPSAESALEEIAEQFSKRDGIYAIAVQHRVGYLDIGGIALFVAVSSAHRVEGFACISELIDEVKARVPIWKKQYLADGGYEWSQCP